MKEYSTINVCGHLHVVCDPTRNEQPFPNYMETGKALCGVVKKGDTLQKWINESTERKEIIKKKWKLN